MPNLTPTIPRTVKATHPLTGFVARQSASSVGNVGRLDASIGGVTPAGGAATSTSLGGDLGVPPPGAVGLFATVNILSFENAFVFAAPGYAESRAHLSFQVEEFSPSGSFIRTVSSPVIKVFDAWATIFGIHLHIDEENRYNPSIQMPVVAGRMYRAWLTSLQFINAVGEASAVSNFTFDFAPIHYSFVVLV